MTRITGDSFGRGRGGHGKAPVDDHEGRRGRRVDSVPTQVINT